MTIAIIGAGIAGAACAQELVRLGKQVVVFDKGRAAGGRMSSKRTATGYLDLGAQYFTARSQAFNQQCQQWLAKFQGCENRRPDVSRRAPGAAGRLRHRGAAAARRGSGCGKAGPSRPQTHGEMIPSTDQSRGSAASRRSLTGSHRSFPASARCGDPVRAA